MKHGVKEWNLAADKCAYEGPACAKWDAHVFVYVCV